MFVEFVIQNQFFSYSLEEFAQILDIPCEGACVFTDRWSLDELAYGVLSEGPYQTNLPSPDDIILYIREDREGQVTRICHKEEIELSNESYVLYDCVMNPLGAQQERKTREDFGTRRGRHSTSSSSAFGQPSFSHFNNDDDGDDEGTSLASTPSPIRYVNSLTNEVPQEHRGGLRSIGKGLQKLVEKYKEIPIRHMALPPREQRHLFLRYKGLEYSDADIADFEVRLARIYRREFVAQLAEHFGLLTAEILGGLTVIAPELPVIDMAELVRLQICAQFDDTWAWVAMSSKRQPNAVAGAPTIAEDAPTVDEGNQHVPAPVNTNNV
ncbi:hypothetical protein Tco_1200558 [Tanacetum coccineum]